MFHKWISGGQSSIKTGKWILIYLIHFSILFTVLFTTIICDNKIQ